MCPTEFGHGSGPFEFWRYHDAWEDMDGSSKNDAESENMDNVQEPVGCGPLPSGIPEEFADLLARQLGSPKGIDRLTSYLYQAKPGTMEMIIDEMLAIRSDIDVWREKKKSQEAQAGYNRWLNSEARWQDEE